MHEVNINGLVIVVTMRQDDWIAYIKDKSGVWECANSPRAALGELIWTLYGVR